MSGKSEPQRSTMSLPPAGKSERRSVCRYSVVQSNAWLGWWVGQDFHNTAAKIVDISLRGAFCTVDDFPPKDLKIWFSPSGPDSGEEWIEVNIIGTKKRLFGSREVRLVFRKVFPYESFKSIVYGPDNAKLVEQPTWMPEEAEERDWW